MSTPTKLFEPFKLGPITLPNRVVMAPLTRNRAVPPGMVPNSLAIDYYSQRASAGLLVTEASQVSQQGQGYQDTPGIYSKEQVAAWRKVTGRVHERGGRIFIQLWHVGRISHTALQAGGGAPVAPSAIRAKGKTFVNGTFADVSEPRALELSEIPAIIEDFRRAAANAKEAGFDGVEIHGANHYAVHQFFSPRANHRDDHWGGTLSKRMNFGLAVAQAVRDALGPKLIAGFRVTPFESEPDGYKLEDAKLLCGELARLDLDYISVSLDDYRNSRPMKETRVYNGPAENNYTPAESPITAFARIIAGRCALMASGGIKTCLDAEGAIEMGADLVAVGRAVVVDPEWFSKVRSKSEASILPGLPRDEREIAGALSIPPRMVQYLLSRPGWIPRL
jgi:2,4-dienoyl-CoA reductase-like NADH-dependent reductase (Old Yellow Enzyme family)